MSLRDRVPSLRSGDDQRSVAIGALVAAQGFDLATTLYGLQAGLVELNPVAAAAMARLGRLPGLACLALVAVGAVVAITETAVRRYGGRALRAGVVRWLGYAPHVAISVAAALNNLVAASVV